MQEVNLIGSRIRQLREQRKYSVETLASQSSCAVDMIEALEAGELVPSLTPLMKLARGLGVRLGTLLDDQSESAPVVVRADDMGEVVHFSGNDATRNKSVLDFHSLAPKKASRHMEPFLIDVHPAKGEKKLSEHEGEEFIFVLNGEIEILYGKDVYQLRTGDSIYYESIVPHHLHAMNGEAKILAVVYAPF